MAGKEVLVCIARHVWSNPCYVIRGEKYYRIDDGRSGFLLNIEGTDLEELAITLHEGIGISEPFGPEDTINPKPPVDAETIYVDGYFGRPFVPAHVYRYDPLKRKQLKELQTHLARLQEEPSQPD